MYLQLKKNISTLLFAISMSIYASAQIPVQDTLCNFLKDVKFKNGVSTVIVKAVYIDMNKLEKGGTIINTLLKEKKIIKDNFSYQIGIKPLNCSNIFYPPSNAKPYLLNASNLGSVVYLTCIVFKRNEWEDHGTPFFIVTKVTLKKK